MKFLKRKTLIEWLIVITIFTVVYAMGWHIEILGGIQRLFLQTGLKQASTEVKNKYDANLNVDLISLDNKQTNLYKLKGKTIFINFWATWCPPCIAEMPGIHTLYEEVKSDDIAFVMISLDEDKEVVKKFIKKKSYNFPVYMLNGTLPSVFESASIPTTFVISPEGKVVLKEVGIANYNTKRFKQFIRSFQSK